MTGRPRDPTYDERVLAAARDELADQGVGRFSLRQVAKRANVPRTSIALRWPDWRSLVIAALDVWTDPPPGHDTGSLRGDLLLLAEDLLVVLEQPNLGLHLRLGADAARHPDLWELYLARTIRPRLRGVRIAFERAAARGEIGADVDAAWETDAFVGALLMRTMGRRRGVRPPGPAARRALIDRTVRALASLQDTASLRDMEDTACSSYDQR
ncbi:Transcriptional regulator, TetR family (fragment) [Frankia canadensis]|uniref:Transcriptional regulator, TetR family n=1 Tax=Frankia canadensis TaxID=1836972 RepID=A0A2I2KUI0_9ACTN